MMREVKIVQELSVHMAGRLRVLNHVKLTLSPSGDWLIDRKEDQRIRKIVALDILANHQDLLSLEELRFFMNLLKIKQLEIARVLGLSDSSISKWKSRETVNLSKAESHELRNYFLDKYSLVIAEERGCDQHALQKEAFYEAFSLVRIGNKLSAIDNINHAMISTIKKWMTPNAQSWIESFASSDIAIRSTEDLKVILKEQIIDPSAVLQGTIIKSGMDDYAEFRKKRLLMGSLQ